MPLPQFLALIALLFSAPVFLVKVPWFVPTVRALQKTVAELEINGTPAYREDLNNRLHREVIALCLYAVGIFAIMGLVGIALNSVRKRTVKLVIWFISLLASFGLVAFEWSALGHDPDRGYMAIFIGLPIIVALIVGAALAIELRVQRVGPR
jgi:hypothetical protein